VPATCYLTGLTIEKGAELSAPAGYKVSLTVDGVRKLLRPGTYAGAIALTVSPVTSGL
jgi:hypothetical protein